MKYIRTKDGIYEITKQYIENHCLVIKVAENRHDLIHESLGIKQADTIEDLFDEFVMNNEIIIGSPRDGMNRLQLADYYAKNDKNVFGAIWTDKGLIYVAKMNDKGELCLL